MPSWAALLLPTATPGRTNGQNERTRDAERIFTGIGRSYDRVATVLSFGQDPRWRRALVDEIRASPHDRVLDVATGTGMVAEALVRRYGCRVVGIDQSQDMLALARERNGTFD